MQKLSVIYGRKGEDAVKGVNKCVVEIVEPQDESIERVLVFFKPDSRAVQLGRQQDAAEQYVSGLVSWRRKWSLSGQWLRVLPWAAGAAACAGLIWLLL